MREIVEVLPRGFVLYLRDSHMVKKNANLGVNLSGPFYGASHDGLLLVRIQVTHIATVPNFTFFTTGRHKRRYTKTAPEFGALQIEPSNDLENTRPRTPIRPKIQRLTQHQRELRRGPARDFWPTQQDFTDDTFVFRDRAKLVRTIEGATADDSLQGFTPDAERPGIDATFRPNFTYIIPSTKHGAVDFENFRRLRKGEVDTRSDLSNAFDKIKVWRSFSETDSDEEEVVAEEAEYLSFSSSGSDRATDEDCAATLGREEGNMSDFDDEYSIGSISTSHSKLSSDTADGSEASELGTTTGLLKNGGGWAQFSTSQSDATLSGQSYFKMMRARRAASRGWGTGQQLRRQQSDVQCGDRDTGASIIIPRTPLLSRQLTT
ncbi:hypothetical protein MN608_03390 [Microdochium nivale]|nr:hypothetical protein MN608_03390 [Microdochium nivale]